MEQKIRWGIVAPGRIAHSFANDLKLVTDGEITAVASRSLDRAESFAKEYNAQHTFGSYEALFECDAVDAVYIATPHTSHAELAVKAMDKGKHVLCEKPMGLHRGDVEQMVAAAERNQVFLMEAMWSRFNPAIRKAKQMVDAGELGEIAYVHADFFGLPHARVSREGFGGFQFLQNRGRDTDFDDISIFRSTSHIV